MVWKRLYSNRQEEFAAEGKPPDGAERPSPTYPSGIRLNRVPFGLAPLITAVPASRTGTRAMTLLGPLGRFAAAAARTG